MRLLRDLASAQGSIVNCLIHVIVVIINVDIYITVLKGSLGALMLTCVGNCASIRKAIRLLVRL